MSELSKRVYEQIGRVEIAVEECNREWKKLVSKS